MSKTYFDFSTTSEERDMLRLGTCHRNLPRDITLKRMSTIKILGDSRNSTTATDNVQWTF